MTEVLIVGGIIAGLAVYVALDHKLNTIQGKVNEMSAQGDAIKGVVDSIRDAVNRLIERLSDNLTGEELEAAKAAGAEITASLDSLDPTVPDGVVDETEEEPTEEPVE